MESKAKSQSIFGKISHFADFEERFGDFFSQPVWSQLQPLQEQQGLFLLQLMA